MRHGQGTGDKGRRTKPFSHQPLLVPHPLSLVYAFLCLVSCVVCPGFTWAADGVEALEALLATQQYDDVVTEANGRLAHRLSEAEERQGLYLKGVALLKLERWETARGIFDGLAVAVATGRCPHAERRLRRIGAALRGVSGGVPAERVPRAGILRAGEGAPQGRPVGGGAGAARRDPRRVSGEF